MPELAVVARGAACAALILLPGWALARCLLRRADLFGIVAFGVALASMSGVLLARLGAFSLTTLAIAGALASVVALAAGRRRGPDPPVRESRRAVRFAALTAGLLAAVWSWPPFETFLGGADSTMYVGAGVHLARTGSLAVEDTVTRILSRPVALGVFSSVGLEGRGPYIRLPGGLLMNDLDGTTATPAFFPLVPVWTGVLTAIAGPAAATAVAPLSLAFAVWAVILFAGELFGLAAAIATALALVTSFPIWWFGRFTMSEPLTMAFVWAALVFVGRRSPFAAGFMFGLAGLARSETLLFTVAALAWWMAWTPISRRDGLALGAGLVIAGIVAATAVLAAPSHHFAYLATDFAFARMRLRLRALPAFLDGRIVAAMVLAPVIPLLIGAMASWRGGSLGRNLSRSVIALGTLIVVALYYRLGGLEEPIRHLRWLATFTSWPALVAGVLGVVILWRRGGATGRLAVLLVLLVAVIFVPNPRVQPWQPWAMRRFLPVLLPALAAGFGVVIATLLGRPEKTAKAFAIALVLAVPAVQLSPVLAVRQHPYFTRNLEAAGRTAESIPPGALVVVDSSFADLQIQVPLWLVYGRETVLVTGGRPLWKEVLTQLAATGRPVYWVQNRLAAAPVAADLTFTPIPSVRDVTLAFPDGPSDTPPSAVIRKLVPLAVYGVAPGAGVRQFSSSLGSS